ncbi:hypothetical protein IQ249_05370 [Lusitaniella coriacea LEGE 07157]|uniref:DUF7734 domain-containing protein n=1 Tax=Lusitaniella coriacea LEGE 07157 TaxID=945747 RepID=A0A8J7DUZ7_9CYAN|nr:hypothetical protein [Lusitaniella coriacea]MBE9115325.1 hypothetical protein [Lusitaniella coriacea LEGE 07157]
MSDSVGKLLERYTLEHPQEVLIVRVKIASEEDRIVIFKGFSSSLVRGTEFDPDVPVLPDEAEILDIDRVAAPYHPDAPQYIERGLSWAIARDRLLGAKEP